MRLKDTLVKVVGILDLHVDYSLGGGNDALQLVMKKFGEKLQIGSNETAETEKRLFYKVLRASISYNKNGHKKGTF